MRNSQKVKRNEKHTESLKPYDNLINQINDGRYIRLNRLKENWLTWIIKCMGNSFFALMIPLNYPLLIIAALVVVEKIYQSYDERFAIPFNLYLWVFIIYIAIYAFKAFIQQIQKNFVSKDIHLIWALNFKGKINNPFYSIESHGKYTEDFNKVLTYYAKAVTQSQIENYQLEINELHKMLERLKELSQFPNDVFESLSRLIEIVADYSQDKTNIRNQYNLVLDRILSEMSSIEILKPLMKQATIMLICEETGNLKIEGQYNIPNGVINSKEIAIGDKFAGKVIKGKELVWIGDVSKGEAKSTYGFEEDLSRVYKGIIGVPVVPKDKMDAIGVINLHSNAILDENDVEQYKIMKILEPYIQLIVSVNKLR